MICRMRILLAVTFTVSLMGLAAVGCGADEPTATPTAQPTPTPTATSTPGVTQETPSVQLAVARGRWRAADLSDYSFTFQWVCFCILEFVAPVDIRVKGSSIDEVSYTEGSGLQGAADPSDYLTVDGLFALIRDAIEVGAASVDIQYEPKLGYPVSGDIDYSRTIADEERGFRLKGFARS